MTLKTSAVSLKGDPSVTPGLAMQYSLISSLFMGAYIFLQFRTIHTPDKL